VKNRMTNDERTRAYRDAHLAKGWTKSAVYRALKRALHNRGCSGGGRVGRWVGVEVFR